MDTYNISKLVRAIERLAEAALTAAQAYEKSVNKR